MDEKFQDKIDNYLFNRMNEAEKAEFLREVEQDADKKEQLEFTQNVKNSIRSREEKLQTLKQFHQQYERERYERERKATAMHATGTDAPGYSPAQKMEEKYVRPMKKIWLWISCVAAVLVVGFFAFRPMFVYESSPNYNGIQMENVRGGDEVFIPAPADSTDTDTIRNNIKKEVTLDE